MASYQFMVTIELRHESGKFASRDEIVEQIRDRLDEAAQEDVDGVGFEGETTYVVEDVLVEDIIKK